MRLSCVLGVTLCGEKRLTGVDSKFEDLKMRGFENEGIWK